MRYPLGPSLSLALHLGEMFGTGSALLIKEVWDRYLGLDRFDRRLARLTERGILEPEPMPEPGLERALRLSRYGRDVASGGRYPPLRWGREWDWLWRAGAFDIPELQASVRKKLRRTLAAAGFGHLQHSVWITPDPVEELRRSIEDLKSEARNLTFMLMRPDAGETDADLVAAAWNFDKYNRGYDLYLEVLRNRPRLYESHAWPKWLQVEWKAWTHAVGPDPLLPAVLLPPGYRGRIAWEERCEVFRSLLLR